MMLITVGLAFHNEERHLREAVASVLRQSRTDLELLLVDDGSTDRSLEIARSFLRDPRVRVLSDGRRRRLPARLNQIVDAARGQFVARMDADDVSHRDRLAKQLWLFAKDARVDAVGTWAALVDEQSSIIGIAESHPESATLQSALERGILPHASTLGRRDWFRAHPYDETLSRAEDRDLWCRTIRSRFDVVAEPLYIIRVLAEAPGFLEDYLESQRQNRILFRRYGVQASGLARTLRQYSASLAKSVVMSGAVRFGVAPLVVRRRGRAPTANEEQLVREALDAND